MKAIREEGQVSDTQRSLSEWLDDAGSTLFDRGIEYGDPRHNFLRIYKIASALGVQLYKIRVKYDGPQPRECFCASVRRKVWYKDFMNWYEKSLRQVHQ